MRQMKRYTVSCNDKTVVGIPGDLHGEIVSKKHLDIICNKISQNCNVVVGVGDNVNLEYMYSATTSKTDVKKLVQKARSELEYIKPFLELLNSMKVGILLCGNHEKWWNKISEKHEEWNSVSWHQMLNIKENYPNIECLDYNDAVLLKLEDNRVNVDNTLVVHGDTLKASTKYGLNLHQVASKYPHYNVVFGHTHKAGVLYHTDYDGSGKSITRFVANVGGLADRDKISYTVEPDYQYGYLELSFQYDAKKYSQGGLNTIPNLQVLG